MRNGSGRKLRNPPACEPDRMTAQGQKATSRPTSLPRPPTEAALRYLLNRMAHAPTIIESAAAANRDAWDREATDGSPCSTPVSTADIEAARRGNWRLRVTGSEPVPSGWLPTVRGLRVLCLGGGGGQQAP